MMLDVSMTAVFVFLAAQSFADRLLPRGSSYFRLASLLLLVAAVTCALIEINLRVSSLVNNAVFLAAVLALFIDAILKVVQPDDTPDQAAADTRRAEAQQ